MCSCLYISGRVLKMCSSRWHANCTMSNVMDKRKSLRSQRLQVVRSPVHHIATNHPIPCPPFVPSWVAQHNRKVRADNVWPTESVKDVAQKEAGANQGQRTLPDALNIMRGCVHESCTCVSPPELTESEPDTQLKNSSQIFVSTVMRLRTRDVCVMKMLGPC